MSNLQFQNILNESLEKNIKTTFQSVLKEEVNNLKNTIQSNLNEILLNLFNEYKVYIYLLLTYIILTLLFLIYISFTSTYILKRIRQ